MGHTRGGVGARTLQVALSTARRGDAVMGVGRAKPNCHACRRVGITVSGTALHQTTSCASSQLLFASPMFRQLFCLCFC